MKRYALVSGLAAQQNDETLCSGGCATRWGTYSQFGRPLADFELVKLRIARMSALTYAMDAVLYMMTGMLDRHDADIMVETAATNGALAAAPRPRLPPRRSPPQ